MSNENDNDNQQQPPQAEPVEAKAEETPSKEKKTKPVPKKAEKKTAAPAAEADDKAPVAEVAATPKAASAEPAAAKPEAAPKKEEPPPPPEPGRYGQLLIAHGFHPTPLGTDAKGVETVDIKANELFEVCQFLRDNSASQFDLLVSVSGVDWKDRLEAVYHLYSTKTYERFVLKATAVDEKLPSVVAVWKTADWHERETYDLFGIVFEGHPNLTRILMPSDWIGYPLRKDYQVEDPRLVWNER